MLELRAIFHGEVQGVGFRAATLQLARELSLKGFVRNSYDGTVEIHAQGAKESLEALIVKLQNTFSIREISSEFVETEATYPGFSIAS